MNILEIIVSNKRKEIARNKERFSIKELEASPFFQRQPLSLKNHLLMKDKPGIIAEVKRKSPSKGDINLNISVVTTTIGYVKAGASALSILTDNEFFGGNNEDLIITRKSNSCPILRKDFMLEEYQIIEAKSIGADAILLIASILNPSEVSDLSKFAKSLQMEVFLEVHSKSELEDYLIDSIDLVGVNNRDLKSFETQLDNSLDIIELIPPGYLKISESGINTPDDVIALKRAGFDGFLIGEAFMKASNPHKACRIFIDTLYTKIKQQEKAFSNN